MGAAEGHRRGKRKKTCGFAPERRVGGLLAANTGTWAIGEAGKAKDHGGPLGDHGEGEDFRHKSRRAPAGGENSKMSAN